MNDYPFLFRVGRQAGHLSPTRTLSLAVVEFVRWACLEAGWVRRVGINDAGVPAGSLSPSVLDRVGTTLSWAGRRRDWVWEGGLLTQPTLDASVTVTVDGAVAAPSAYTVDYPRGVVTFKEAFATAPAVVKASHLRRLVQVADVDVPWVHKLDKYSLADDDDRRGGPGGDLSVDPSRRVQMPAVGVFPAFGFGWAPHELGSGALRATFPVDLVVATETPWERAWLHDALVLQVGGELPTFDPNAAPPPLDAGGTPVAGALSYPALCSQYPWRPTHIVDASSHDAWDDASTFRVRVRWTLRVDGV